MDFGFRKLKIFISLGAFLFLYSTSVYAKSSKEWAAEMKEMCATEIASSKPSDKSTTEADGYCAECLNQNSMPANLMALKKDAKNVEDTAKVKRDVLFFKKAMGLNRIQIDSLGSLEYALKIATAALLVKEALYLSPDERKNYEAFQWLSNKYKFDGSEENRLALKAALELHIQSLKAHKDLLLETSNKKDVLDYGYSSSISATQKANEDALSASISFLDALNEKDLPADKMVRLNNRIAPGSLLTSADSFENDKAFIKSISEKIKNKKQLIASGQNESSDSELLEKFEKAAKSELESQDVDPDLCGMSPAEVYAIVNYTGNGYSQLNTELRTGKISEENAAFREELESALKKLKKFNGQVKRGATLPEKDLEQHQVGAIIDYPAFTSTSKSDGFFSEQKFIILSKSGRYIAPISAHKNEDEVLFLPKTKFKVLSVELRDPIKPGDSEMIIYSKKQKVDIVLEEVD